MKHNNGISILMAFFFLLSGCATTGNNNLNSTLWIQSSSEYKANSLQTYNFAEKNIDLALNDSGWTAALEQSGDFSSLTHVAVVMDIDETVLDNSKYQAKLVLDGAEWSPDSWDNWIALKSASAVPGAVDFIHNVEAKNIDVIYITNRECKPRQGVASKCPQEKDTIDNLGKVGIKDVNPKNILLQNELPGWTSEKQSRRESIVSNYRVLMLFGDDLGDFLPNVKKNITSTQRDKLVLQNESNWGRKWYMLSNPTYGSWLNVLEQPKSKYLVGY